MERFRVSKLDILHPVLCLVFFVLMGPDFSQAGEQQNQEIPWKGIGHSATTLDIKKWDIEISPNGEGLPAGKGFAQKGRQLFLQKCAVCHGPTGVEGPQNKLVGGQGTLNTSSPVKTIGSYWPYATTIYDYIYRAMPFTAPQSLRPDEVYSLVAWILYQNNIIQEDEAMTQKTLPLVHMPNRNGFVPDPRPSHPSLDP